MRAIAADPKNRNAVNTHWSVFFIVDCEISLDDQEECSGFGRSFCSWFATRV